MAFPYMLWSNKSFLALCIIDFKTVDFFNWTFHSLKIYNFVNNLTIMSVLLTLKLSISSWIKFFGWTIIKFVKRPVHHAFVPRYDSSVGGAQYWFTFQGCWFKPGTKDIFFFTFAQDERRLDISFFENLPWFSCNSLRARMPCLGIYIWQKHIWELKWTGTDHIIT